MIANLPPAGAPARVINVPFDLFRYEMFMTMRPPDDVTAIEIVDQIWLPVLGWRAPGTP